MSLDNPTLPLDGLITLGLGVLCTLIYWAPAAMEQKFLISNGMLQTASWSQSFELLISSFFLLNNPVIAWALGMASLGAISLGSFQTGAVLLAGLFCYDVFWVFGTDVMMTVATKGMWSCYELFLFLHDHISSSSLPISCFHIEVEAPVKFLYTAPLSDTPRPYPFSVLGLGDGKHYVQC